ncbi:MAG: hypothetical protein D4S01_00865, partial [Dehalococcoidia bacterium]
DNATDVEIAAMFRNEQKYLQSIKDAQLIETSFYDARTEVISELEQAYRAEREALVILWQLKEDNGFDVDYVPE